MNHRWPYIVGALLPVLAFAQIRPAPEAQAVRAPYARIAIMRALDGHSVDWEAGYVRHLEWHRQAKDPFAWYSYSVWRRRNISGGSFTRHLDTRPRS